MNYQGLPEEVETFAGSEDAAGQSFRYEGGSHAFLQPVAIPPQLAMPAHRCTYFESYKASDFHLQLLILHMLTIYDDDLLSISRR